MCCLKTLQFIKWLILCMITFIHHFKDRQISKSQNYMSRIHFLIRINNLIILGFLLIYWSTIISLIHFVTIDMFPYIEIQIPILIHIPIFQQTSQMRCSFGGFHVVSTTKFIIFLLLFG